MTPGDRLKIARERAGYGSAASAAEAMGVPKPSYGQYENGTRGITVAKARRFARFFRVAPEWVLYGKGDNPNQTPLPEPEVVTSFRLVPVVGKVQAGVFSPIAENDELLGNIGLDLPNFNGIALFALEVVGPSMNMFYPDGSHVIVCSVTDIGVRENDHVVIRSRRFDVAETTIKEVVKGRAGIELWPRSTEPAFQKPIHWSPDAHTDIGLEIIGVVVASYSVRPSATKPLLTL